MTPEVLMLQKYWTSPLGTGGSERIIDRVSAALSHNNVRTIVATCGDYARGVELPTNFQSPELHFVDQSRVVQTIPTIPQITDYVCKNYDKIDLIQIAWGYEHYPEQLKRILELPKPKIFVMLEIGHFDQMVQNFDRLEEKELYMNLLRQKLNTVVAISRPLQSEAVSLGFPDVELIYGPIPNMFHPISPEDKTRNRKELGLPEDRITYVYAGRLVEEKGVDHIIEAWEELDPQVRDRSSLVIAGSLSSAKNEIRESFEHLKATHANSVFLLGAISDEATLARIYSSGDVFLYPTRHREGLAMAPAEAMACGLPIITTEYAVSNTGMSDIAIPGKTCAVYPENQGVAGLIDRIAFFQEPSERIDFGLRGIKLIESLDLSPESVAKKYLSLYQKLLGKY